MIKYHVVVKCFNDETYRKNITDKPVSERGAERIERGANINLNHDKFYTELEDIID